MSWALMLTAKREVVAEKDAEWIEGPLCKIAERRARSGTRRELAAP